MSNVIISAGVGAWYPRGVERLENSLKEHGWQGEVLTWKDELPPGSPSHQDNPYAFKIFAFEEAIRRGHRNILWCDSSVWAVKNPEPIFSLIQNQGYYLWDSGYKCNEWTSDKTLAHFGLTREQARSIPMISANIMGFDAHTETAKNFLARWRIAMSAGLFIGPWNRAPEDAEAPEYLGHRHDQASASLIANQLGLTLEPWGRSCQYWEPDESRISKTICLTLAGM